MTAHISGETYFFRDHGQFDLLRLRLLPELIERHSQTKNLRLWSAGCSSGEETYSLAILIDMLLPVRDDWNIFIIGSDIDSNALAKAQTGRYGSWSFRTTSTELKQRYFIQQGNEWRLDERIRNMVTFRSVDLIGEPFPNDDLQDMDLILCRNVFIYLDTDSVAAVANKLAAAISQGGYLMTAHTELIGQRIPNTQSRLFAEGVVYQRIASTPNLPPPVIHALPATPSIAQYRPRVQLSPPSLNIVDLLTTAQEFADRGQYDRAEQICRQALNHAPLAVKPHFLLAQLAQLQGDFEQAETLLNKTLYLDPDCIAAILELAALYERAEKLTKAQSLRHTALNIINTLPADAKIEPYETTAEEIAQWLAQ